MGVGGTSKALGYSCAVVPLPPGQYESLPGRRSPFRLLRSLRTLSIADWPGLKVDLCLVRSAPELLPVLQGKLGTRPRFSQLRSVKVSDRVRDNLVLVLR